MASVPVPPTNMPGLFNPLEYGRITRVEAEREDVAYVRNGKNIELREYMMEKFNIPDNDWHFEEYGEDWIQAISNKNEVVKTTP